MPDNENENGKKKTIKRSLPEINKNNVDGFKQANKAAKQLADTLKSISTPYKGLFKTIEALESPLGKHSALSEAAKNIGSLQKSLDSLPKFEHIPLPDYKITSLDIPPNPVHETNKKLENIEKRFDNLYEIATESAKVANSLNAAALDFLVKFEKAAKSNDRAAGKAIWIGIIAMIIAFAMPASQIAYNEFWAGPKALEREAEAALLLKSEVAELKKEQSILLKEISESIKTSEQSSSEVLRSIDKTLKSKTLKSKTNK